jgi:hypothetical protein
MGMEAEATLFPVISKQKGQSCTVSKYL